ncbi:MAG: hypothetical protein QGG09_17435 [Pirellulaceae bacterium]|nr:hypothetical protein [Pirellulaceae bacterium]
MAKERAAEHGRTRTLQTSRRPSWIPARQPTKGPQEREAERWLSESGIGSWSYPTLAFATGLADSQRQK